MEVLTEKGAIENLIPYLEKSDVIGEEDIVDSAYQVLTADGGLYMLPTNFVSSEAIITCPSSLG